MKSIKSVVQYVKIYLWVKMSDIWMRKLDNYRLKMHIKILKALNYTLSHEEIHQFVTKNHSDEWKNFIQWYYEMKILDEWVKQVRNNHIK